MRKIATAIAITVWIIKRGRGFKLARSSINPISPRNIAGNNKVAASGNVVWVLSDRITAANVRTTTEIAIASPPKYGTGSFWLFLSRFGLSIAPIEIATLRTGQVRNPARRNPAIPKSRYSVGWILTWVSIGKLLLV
jgi:hypothetical protein